LRERPDFLGTHWKIMEKPRILLAAKFELTYPLAAMHPELNLSSRFKG